MPNVLKMQTAEHLVSEAEDFRSRDEVSVNGGADPGILAGTVLGMITASGTYVQHDPDATDGSEDAKAVLFEGAIGLQRRTIHARDCQVAKSMLTYAVSATEPQIAATDVALRALGIIPRA